MSPRTKEQLDDLRNEKRNLILDAALDLFGHEGYHRTPISAIAKHAGISKGLVYTYFESKEDLLRAVLIKGFEALDVFNEMFPEGMKTKADLERVIGFYMQMVTEQGAYWKLYFSLIMQVNLQELLGNVIEEIAGPLIEKMAAFFVAKGSANPIDEAMLLGNTLDGVFINYLANPAYTNLESMKQLIVEKFG